MIYLFGYIALKYFPIKAKQPRFSPQTQLTQRHSWSQKNPEPRRQIGRDNPASVAATTIESPASSSCRSDSGPDSLLADLDRRRLSTTTTISRSRRRSSLLSVPSTIRYNNRRRRSSTATTLRSFSVATGQQEEEEEEEEDYDEEEEEEEEEEENDVEEDEEELLLQPAAHEAFVVLMSDSFEVISLPADMMQV